MYRQDDEPTGDAAFLESFRCVETAQGRHADAADDHVGAQMFSGFDREAAIDDGADDVEPILKEADQAAVTLCDRRRARRLRGVRMS
jgi:hypothetical protein